MWELSAYPYHGLYMVTHADDDVVWAEITYYMAMHVMALETVQ